MLKKILVTLLFVLCLSFTIYSASAETVSVPVNNGFITYTVEKERVEVSKTYSVRNITVDLSLVRTIPFLNLSVDNLFLLLQRNATIEDDRSRRPVFLANLIIQHFNLSPAKLVDVRMENVDVSNTTNITGSVDQTDESTVINTTYKETKINKISYNSKVYDFTTHGCWVCGNKIACLDNKDGGQYVMYRQEQFKCDINNMPIIRSGESGYIQNMDTGEILYSSNDI